jgi:hypothetical protein
MLGHDPYYHEIIRKTVIAFGSMFNDVYLVRRDKTGAVKQKLHVPLSYGPKEKFLARLKEDPNINKSVAITLPRFGFEMAGFTYNQERKTNKINTIKKKIDGKNVIDRQYSPVPYDIDFNFYIMVKNSDDGVQLLEEILPIFSPSHSVSIKDDSEMKRIQDINMTLTSVDYADEYEGDYETRRAIIYSLQFSVSVNLYGPVVRQGQIKKVDTSIYSDVPVNAPSRTKVYTAQEDSSVEPLSGDDFGFSESWSENGWEDV